jgi:hypothetical protein
MRCNKIRSPAKDKVRRPLNVSARAAPRSTAPATTSSHRPPADEKIDRRHIRAVARGRSSRLRLAMRRDPGCLQAEAEQQQRTGEWQRQKRTRCPRKLRPGSKYSQGAMQKAAAGLENSRKINRIESSRGLRARNNHRGQEGRDVKESRKSWSDFCMIQCILG